MLVYLLLVCIRECNILYTEHLICIHCTMVEFSRYVFIIHNLYVNLLKYYVKYNYIKSVKYRNYEYDYTATKTILYIV